MITLLLTACLIRYTDPSLIYQQTLVKPVKVEAQAEVVEENLQEYVEEPVPEDSCFDGPVEYGNYYEDIPGEDSLAWVYEEEQKNE